MTAVVNVAQKAVAPTPPSLTMARRQLSRLHTSGFETRAGVVEVGREEEEETVVEATTGFELEATADVDVEVSEPTLPMATQEQAELI